MQSVTLALMAPFLIGLVASALLEAGLRPRPAPFHRRSPASVAVHIGSWCLLFALFTLVLQRPWFALVFVLSLTLVVVQSSNTKSSTLKEPFICHDFEYFWDAILHPRLYVPFFGIGLAVAASSAGALAIGGFFYFEPSLAGRFGAAYIGPLAGCAALGALLVAVGLGKSPRATFEPAADLHRLGLFTSLWRYGVALYRSTPPKASDSPFEPLTAQAPTPGARLQATPLPHVVLVQSESFFDPRPWCDDIPQSALAHFDETRAQAVQKGALEVPAWGANTVRTECAVLTGLAPGAWGARQFNPYHTLARQGLPSLASAFQARGYRTVCVHPYNARFYKRDRVMPNLGFETFIDIDDFPAELRHGQYTSDLAVARKVGRLLEDDDNRPLFVFVITMENHGPLHLEAPDQASASALLPSAHWPLPRHLRDLAVYLKHLGEADRMIDALKRSLTGASRPGLLAFYGDHVPILPEAYAHYGDPDGQTPYMIWSTESEDHGEATPEALKAQTLGVALFNRALGGEPHGEWIKAAPEPQEQE
ncbi:LTA synthase family protein [Halomonas sp. HNIBRBA4712]|uniref:LTA synthase family protein n=1 Tax=Halomonas sp. HNIBRBA4712 TaxID=3373087 RepID=UPI00374724D9